MKKHIDPLIVMIDIGLVLTFVTVVYAIYIMFKQCCGTV